MYNQDVVYRIAHALGKLDAIIAIDDDCPQALIAKQIYDDLEKLSKELLTEDEE